MTQPGPDAVLVACSEGPTIALARSGSTIATFPRRTKGPDKTLQERQRGRFVRRANRRLVQLVRLVQFESLF
jgi:hypothetical protein